MTDWFTTEGTKNIADREYADPGGLAVFFERPFPNARKISVPSVSSVVEK